MKQHLLFFTSNSVALSRKAIGAELSFLAMLLLIKLAVSLLDFNLNPELAMVVQMKRIIQEF
jgi:hypothetical protein